MFGDLSMFNHNIYIYIIIYIYIWLYLTVEFHVAAEKLDLTKQQRDLTDARWNLTKTGGEKW